MRLKQLILFFIISVSVNFGQIQWTPYFATDQDSIVVTFDATQGNGGLAGYTGDVYAHTGVLTNQSATPSSWRYVKTDWGVNTPETKLTRIGTDLYQFVIRPSVRSFYNVPSNETITNVAFVFRSASAPYREGKTADGGDIFLPLSTSGLNVAITIPNSFPQISLLNDTIQIQAVSNQATSITLYIDNVQVAQTPTSTLNFNYITNSYGKKWIKAVASAGISQATDSFYVIVRPPVTIENAPAGTEDGINYISGTSVILQFYAPQKEYAYVIGDFNNWEIEPNYYMKKTTDGSRYWMQVNGLGAFSEQAFQYYVDGAIRFADPYADKILDPWNDSWISSSTYPNLKQYPTGKTNQVVSVLQTAQSQYQWLNTNFQRPKNEDLVIYELLIRDFTDAHTYKSLTDTIDYFVNLGINAIELMPVMEFEGNESWGYNPMFKFAPDKFYGHKNELKRFIDKAHEKGIAVILDIVLNHHFGNSPLVRLYWDAVNNQPDANSPWFNPVAKHPYNVGYDFNHESQATKDYVDKVCKYWLTEYKVDGFRFDLSKGFTQTNSGSNVGFWGQYDLSRINLLKRMADKIWEVDSTAYIILEHFADNSEEIVLANYGMMLWGNMNHNYNEATMGYNESNKSDLTWGSYKARGWQKPHLITYMESHDEERLMYKNLQYGNSSGNYNIKSLNTALSRIKLAAAFFFTIPGPKMIWQFGELGYDYSINYPCMTDACRLDKKPIKWDYYDNINRRNVYKVFHYLINLKKNYDAFRTTDYSLSVSSALKRIQLNHSSMNVNIVGNFDVIARSITPAFQNTGTWYNYFLNDTLYVTDVNSPIELQPGEFHIYTTVKLPEPEQGILLGTDKKEISGVVEKFDLDQNFPNPFNPATTIRYSIPERGFVTLKVYNILGKELTTLVNGEHSPGIYETTFDAGMIPGGIASGVYFYRLSVNENSVTRKMLLMQ
jgi:1,4-alpha-glucan branching enzyme